MRPSRSSSRRCVDFLLPHGNWTNPPPGRDPSAIDAPYGAWLAKVFDHWYSLSPPGCRVRMFSEIIHSMLGGQATVETVGLAPVRLIVVATDGTLEQVDTLRSAYAGAAGTGLQRAHARPGYRHQAPGHHGTSAWPGWALRHVPGLRAPPRLRRRALHPQIPGGHRVHESFGVLPGSGPPDPAYPPPRQRGCGQNQPACSRDAPEVAREPHADCRRNTGPDAH